MAVHSATSPAPPTGSGVGRTGRAYTAFLRDAGLPLGELVDPGRPARHARPPPRDGTSRQPRRLRARHRRRSGKPPLRPPTCTGWRQRATSSA